MTSLTIDLDSTDVSVSVDTPGVDIGVPGPRGQTGHQIVFGTAGPVLVKTGTLGYYPRVNGHITRVTATVSDQISGSTRTDVNINGTSIFTSVAHQPTLAGTGRHYDDADTIDAGTFLATDYFTADVDTVGVGTTNLIITVDYVEE